MFRIIDCRYELDRSMRYVDPSVVRCIFGKEVDLDPELYALAFEDEESARDVCDHLQDWGRQGKQFGVVPAATFLDGPDLDINYHPSISSATLAIFVTSDETVDEGEFVDNLEWSLRKKVDFDGNEVDYQARIRTRKVSHAALRLIRLRAYPWEDAGH